MTTSQTNTCQESNTIDEQQQFLELLPDIQNYASFAFRTLRDEAKAEAVAETIANAFVAFRRLIARDQKEKAYPSVLVRYAVSQIRCGRRVGMKVNCRDVLSVACHVKHGVCVRRLNGYDVRTSAWKELVLEDRRTPVPDQAAFRCDFPAWLESLPGRKRKIVNRLSAGETTSEIAESFKLSAARVSQIRRELKDSWYEFHGELIPSTEISTFR